MTNTVQKAAERFVGIYSDYAAEKKCIPFDKDIRPLLDQMKMRDDLKDFDDLVRSKSMKKISWCERISFSTYELEWVPSMILKRGCGTEDELATHLSLYYAHFQSPHESHALQEFFGVMGGIVLVGLILLFVIN